MESQSRQAQIQFHHESIAAAQKELDLKKQVMESAEGRLGDFKERFGTMDMTEQARAKSLLSLSDKANTLRESGDIEGAKSIERRFTPDDISTLKGYGLEGASNAARSAAYLRAEDAGIGDSFGREERNRIREFSPEVEKLTADITGKVEATYRLELDEAQASKALEGAMGKVYGKLAELADKVTELTKRQTSVEVNSQREKASRAHHAAINAVGNS